MIIKDTLADSMNYEILGLLIVVAVFFVIKRWFSGTRRSPRQDYYNNDYLKSDAWQRKRYVVLRRDSWHCVNCGKPATEVHHKRYARNIGNEPIKWLVSICKDCHDTIHQ